MLYVLLALPAWLAVIASGIVALRPRLRWGFLFAVAVITAASLWRYEFDGRYSREDVRGAVRYIAEQPEAFDCLFAPTVWQIVEHYAPRGTPVYEVFRRHWVPVKRVDEQLFELFSACNAFLVHSRPRMGR